MYAGLHRMVKLREILTYEGRIEQSFAQRDQKSRAGIDGMSGKDAFSGKPVLCPVGGAKPSDR